ncbi:hypothetical protein G6L37_05055 [Agrobacterium rubi]|nr:hypothetical protein [Agrobacterium rubi]NTF24724.1 hypothetical protein [Agrobacterium rubi]
MTDGSAMRSQFLGRIRFRPSVRKLANCLLFLRATNRGSEALSRSAIGSVLLLAEGTHLSKYGRPVTGCDYDVSTGYPLPTIIGDAELRIAGMEPIGSVDVGPLVDGIVPEVHEETFPELSRSDMGDLWIAAVKWREAPDEASTLIASMIHDGRADYALMLEEGDAEVLFEKLQDLAGWSKYFHLGTKD